MEALTAEPEPTVEQGIAMYQGAYYGLLQVDRQAQEMVRRCRAVAETLDDDFLRAHALYVETYEMLMWSRDIEHTLASFEECRRLLTASGDLFPLAAGYINTAEPAPVQPGRAWAASPSDPRCRRARCGVVSPA